MARIPLGNFGNRGPDRIGPSQVDARGMAAASGALADVGQAGSRMVSRQIELQAIEQRKTQSDDEDLAAAKAANALNGYELHQHALAEDISGQIQRGEIPYDQAGAEWDARAQEIEVPEIAGLSPVSQERYRGGIQNRQVAGKLLIDGAVKQARRDDGKTQIDTMFGLKDKEAGIPGADIDAIYQGASAWAEKARTFGVPESVFQKRLQDEKDKAWFNQATQRSIETRDDLGETKKLVHDLSAEDGFYLPRLDASRRNALLQAATGNQARLEAKTQIEADKRETDGAQALRFYQENTTNLIPMDPSTFLALRERTRGTASEAEFDAAAAQATELQTVSHMPFAQQQQYADQLEASIRSTPNTAPKQAETRLRAIRASLDASKTRATESPILFAQTVTGQTIEPLDFQGLVPGNDSSIIASQLATRYSLLQGMRKKFGPEVSLNPWRPEEAKALQNALAKANSDEAKLGVLNVLGRAVPTDEAFRDTLAPIAQSDRVTYLAGVEQHLEHRSEQGIEVAPVILHGARVWKDKSVPLPSEAEFAKAFEEDVGSAYQDGSPDRADAYLRYKMLYAGLADRASSRDDKLLDEKLRGTVLSLATGGVTDYQGQKIVKPYGWSDSKFTDRMNTEVERIATDTGFTTDTIRRHPLMALPETEGQYFLRNGSAFLTDKKGRPLIVRLK